LPSFPCQKRVTLSLRPPFPASPCHLSPASGIESEEQIKNQIGSIKMSTPSPLPKSTSKFLNIKTPPFCSPSSTLFFSLLFAPFFKIKYQIPLQQQPLAIIDQESVSDDKTTQLFLFSALYSFFLSSDCLSTCPLVYLSTYSRYSFPIRFFRGSNSDSCCN
jgi:hypothetical protein